MIEMRHRPTKYLVHVMNTKEWWQPQQYNQAVRELHKRQRNRDLNRFELPKL